ncbi:MAG: hypothetical protein J7K04_15525 [Spirochaetales bacterium]|nr:hypothetical protein [Spirochaetales bacterium]
MRFFSGSSKYFKLIFLLFGILILTSCIGVDTTISFNDNGSGKLSIQYKISKMVVNLGASNEEAPVVPLPVSEDDFKRSVEKAKGLKLLSYKQSEDENDIYIAAVIGFNRIENFKEMKGFNSMPATLKKQGDSFLFSQRIATKPEHIPDEDSLKMIDTLFKGYKISFTIKAPKEIQSHNMGNLSSDKRTLTYSIPVAELVRIGEDIYLTISW